MRIQLFARPLLAILALAASSLLLHAQFQQPTDEELKMTSDPKAPGAAAVYLNIDEVDNDPIHFRSVYVRIKVLQEKGKELATVTIPYMRTNFKITDIKGRTIHSDGTIIPLAGKAEDLMVAKTVSKEGDAQQFNKKVFTLPSVEVGSILEYKYEIRYDDNHFSSPEWEVQRSYFIHKESYAFTPFKAFLPGIQNATSMYLIDEHGHPVNTLIWWPILPAGAKIKVDITGRHLLELTDVPPIPDEQWMPPIESLIYKVTFYYKSASSAADFWVSEAKYWSKDVDRFAESSKTLKEAVAGLIAPTDGELDKAKKIYKAVQALDNTDYSRKKSGSEMKQLKLKAAKHAEDTWQQKSGDSEDIAMLYLAMLRAAGLTAYGAKVVDRERALFDITYLRMEQLDDTLVILKSGDKEIVLDPGEKMCPFQTVSWRHSAATGVRQSPDGRALFPLPFSPTPTTRPFVVSTPIQSYTDNKTVRNSDLTVDQHGGVTGSINIVMTGQQALHWRQQALRNDSEEVKKQFDHQLESIVPEGVEAKLDHFLGIDDPDVKLIALVKVRGSLGTATSKRLLLPGSFFDTRGHQPFVNQEKRLESVDMKYGNQVSDQVTYYLPAGMTVEGAPKDDKIAWPQHSVYITKSKSEPGKITIANVLSVAFTFAKAEEYQDLRGFYQKVDAANQAQLVLANASPAAVAAPAAASDSVISVVPEPAVDPKGH